MTSPKEIILHYAIKPQKKDGNGFLIDQTSLKNPWYRDAGRTFEVSEEGMTSFVRSVTWKKGGVLYDTLLITPKKNPQESLDFFKDLTLRVLRVSLH